MVNLRINFYKIYREEYIPAYTEPSQRYCHGQCSSCKVIDRGCGGLAPYITEDEASILKELYPEDFV